MNYPHLSGVVVGLSDLLWGRDVGGQYPMEKNEDHDTYGMRTVRDRFHQNKDGQLLIPAFAILVGVQEAAKFAAIKKKGNATMTKDFSRGVIVEHDLMLDKTRDDLLVNRLSVPSDGQRGGGKRVPRYFPSLVPGWRGTFDLTILSPSITEEHCASVMYTFGMFIGFGAMRVQNGGVNGRFKIEDLKWVPA